MMNKTVNILTTCAAFCAIVACCLTGCNGDGDGNGQTCGMTEVEMQLLDLINDLRASGTDCGGEHYGSTHPLICHPGLVDAAREHSEDMAENNYFDHTGLDGRLPWDRFRDAGYEEGGAMGENIAAGYADPASIIDRWHISPDHCKGMMNPTYNVVGIGYASSESSVYVHYWTLALASGGL